MTHTHPISSDPRFLDITGKRFGRLVVNGCAGKRIGGRIWHCTCDCGNKTVSAGSKLRSGATKSCGCLNREQCGNQFRTHGLSHKIPEYHIWNQMRQRCLNRRHRQFLDYGGRGISVCERWNSFAAFLEDMGKRPEGKFTIERHNNAGNYEPSNCCWATPMQQSRNKRNNRMLTAHGKTMCLTDWAKELNIDKGTLHSRLKNGCPVERALAKPGLLR